MPGLDHNSSTCMLHVVHTYSYKLIYGSTNNADSENSAMVSRFVDNSSCLTSARAASRHCMAFSRNKSNCSHKNGINIFQW